MFLKNLALMLDTIGEVSELSLALQSESTTLSKAYELVNRCIRALAQFKDGHSEEHTKTADDSCGAGEGSSFILQSENREPRQILSIID